MPVVSTRTDPADRAVTIDIDLDAPPSRVWELWSNPERLRRWWGPPGHPMVVTHHDLRAGGNVAFHVELPDGVTIGGRFDLIDVRPYEALAFEFTSDGLEDRTDIHVSIDSIETEASRMTIVAKYRDDRAMRRALAIGFDRGMANAAAQADAALL